MKDCGTTKITETESGFTAQQEFLSCINGAA
jgi:hypothetical protein